MPKCQIMWIDAQGQPTPDGNDAVMLALVHRLKVGDVGYEPEISETFHICAEHYARIQPHFKYENGGAWQFAPLPEEV